MSQARSFFIQLAVWSLIVGGSVFLALVLFELMMQKMREEEEVQKRLNAFNEKMEKHERLKVASVQRTIERVRYHTEEVRARSLLRRDEDS